MDTKLEPIVQALQEKFSTSFEEYSGEVHVFVNSVSIIEALTLLREGFESLEEDFAEEQFYAAARATYWASPEQSEQRTLSASLIDRLEF